ncbi:MAG TPA: condensation domain-containing protein, partial [Longimicrobium sp.]|nr:condensation domain-containing protein [Longimicrobium sp.]
MTEIVAAPHSTDFPSAADTPPPASIFVPADFPLARVTQAELDAVLASQGGDDAVDDLYPLTPLQQGILFHALEAPRSGQYVEQLGVTLRGLDPDAYVRAWQTVVDRHTALRTAFVTGLTSEPLQVVRRDAELPVEGLDWSAFPRDQRQARLDAHAANDVQRGFDVARAPLFRLALIRTGADEHRVLITFHHLLLDGWSGARVFAEAEEIYQALRAGRAPELSEPRPFRDYVAWLLRRDPEQAEAFWRREMAGAEPAELGVGRPRAGRVVSEFGERELRLAGSEVEAAQALARGAGVTLNTVFQGALALLLSRYTGRDDVVFGAVSSGRDGDLAGIGEIVGMTINTLPVRVRLSRDARVAPWLRELQSAQTEARRHDQAPLYLVQKWSGVPADRPLFEALFVFENYPVAGGRDADDEDDEAAADVRMVERTNYPLTLTVIPGSEARLRLTWDAARLTDAEAERIGAHLRTLAAAMARDGDAPVATLPMLGDDERRLLVETLNDTDRPIPPAPIHRLFEEVAARTPDASALSFDGGRMTYAELDAAAARLARRLRSRGVGPESRVGVSVERSPELIVALLAVLKAGGAYVPLDPAYPAERLSFMLEDAGVSVLIVKDSEGTGNREPGTAGNSEALASFTGEIVRIG